MAGGGLAGANQVLLMMDETTAAVQDIVMTGITHHRIQPYLHTGNGIVERTNRSVLEHMRTLIWDKRLEFHGEHVVRFITNGMQNSQCVC